MSTKMMLFALCALLPALMVSAIRPACKPFTVTGKVYCDTCRAGFETSATTYIAGARVRVECKARDTNELVFSKEATTDSNGAYRIPVSEDHKDQVCDAMLISSPQRGCSVKSPGRDRARVSLTWSNGITSGDRFANNMGFMMDAPLSGCTQILQQYKEDDEQL